MSRRAEKLKTKKEKSTIKIKTKEKRRKPISFVIFFMSLPR